MTKNPKCRKQIRDALLLMEIDDSFSLDWFIEEIRTPRGLTKSKLLQRQPIQRVAMILTEYVVQGFLDREQTTTRTIAHYRVVKLLE